MRGRVSQALYRQGLEMESAIFWCFNHKRGGGGGGRDWIFCLLQVSYKKTDSRVLVSTIGGFFKHLLTLSLDNNLLLHSKLDDVDITRNRTADITYDNFENKSGVDFSTYREITVSEKNRLDIRLNYKQYEFNKELSVRLNVPKNFKVK